MGSCRRRPHSSCSTSNMLHSNLSCLAFAAYRIADIPFTRWPSETVRLLSLPHARCSRISISTNFATYLCPVPLRRHGKQHSLNARDPLEIRACLCYSSPTMGHNLTLPRSPLLGRGDSLCPGPAASPPGRCGPAHPHRPRRHRQDAPCAAGGGRSARPLCRRRLLCGAGRDRRRPPSCCPPSPRCWACAQTRPSRCRRRCRSTCATAAAAAGAGQLRAGAARRPRRRRAAATPARGSRCW